MTKLQRIVDAGSETLQGQYVEPLRGDAEEILGKLTAASRRYHDVSSEIDKYEPELAHAIDEVGKAETAEADGQSNLTKANAMPDAQPGPDGTIPPEEQDKADAKKRALEAANADITAAQTKLTTALDALDRAGEAFGAAVDFKRYDDGLTDKVHWTLMRLFALLSKIFGWIALALTILAFFIPGAGWLAIAGLMAGIVTLVSDSVLYHGGDGSVASLVLGALGLVFAGLGTLAGKFAGIIGKLMPKGLPGGGLQGANVFLMGGPKFLGAGAGGNIVTKPGFFTNFSNLFTGGPKATFFTWWASYSGGNTLGHLGMLDKFNLLGFTVSGTTGQFLWAGWNVTNQSFNFIGGMVIGGLMVAEDPAVAGWE
ncbi:hypothetical protein Acsp01_27310 [Actinoplanes sp. NBRC 101535]|nr:hypothetical protein Acsp01_27310 [Actinoplanes sp. NBRC 101535]